MVKILDFINIILIISFFLIGCQEIKLNHYDKPKLESLLGKSFEFVLQEFEIDPNRCFACSEPPGLYRMVYNDKYTVYLYVTRENALENLDKPLFPEAFLKKPVDGIAIMKKGKWLGCGKGIIWRYHSNDYLK